MVLKVVRGKILETLELSWFLASAIVLPRNFDGMAGPSLFSVLPGSWSLKPLGGLCPPSK